MWQKNDSKVQPNKDEGAPKVKTEDRTERTVVGSSIRIKGELSGSEELLIMGQVQGAVHLKQNSVTVGQKAKIKADIFAKSIHVEGDVQGNLYGEERITLHQTATTQGNLVAPRVSLQMEPGLRVRLIWIPGWYKERWVRSIRSLVPAAPRGRRRPSTSSPRLSCHSLAL